MKGMVSGEAAPGQPGDGGGLWSSLTGVFKGQAAQQPSPAAIKASTGVPGTQTEAQARQLLSQLDKEIRSLPALTDPQKLAQVKEILRQPLQPVSVRGGRRARKTRIRKGNKKASNKASRRRRR